MVVVVMVMVVEDMYTYLKLVMMLAGRPGNVLY